jgi:DNA excision repair protein ERCC-4
MLHKLSIVADYREKTSGIPQLLLLKEDVDLMWGHLKVGDYLINGDVCAERKTATDFITSVISHRVFDQCARLNKLAGRPFLIIEGNPYKTDHKITQQAVQGALLSISVAWQIPVLFSRDKPDTVQMLFLAGQQSLPNQFPVLPAGYKPKRLKNRQLFFLQGIPSVGPSLALRLLQVFGNVEGVLNATINDLRTIEGIGKRKAAAIREFLEAPFKG